METVHLYKINNVKTASKIKAFKSNHNWDHLTNKSVFTMLFVTPGWDTVSLWSNWSTVQPSSTYNEWLNWKTKQKKKKSKEDLQRLIYSVIHNLWDISSGYVCADRAGHCVLSAALWWRDERWIVKRIKRRWWFSYNADAPPSFPCKTSCALVLVN